MGLPSNEHPARFELTIYQVDLKPVGAGEFWAWEATRKSTGRCAGPLSLHICFPLRSPLARPLPPFRACTPPSPVSSKDSLHANGGRGPVNGNAAVVVPPPVYKRVAFPSPIYVVGCWRHPSVLCILSGTCVAFKIVLGVVHPCGGDVHRGLVVLANVEVGSGSGDCRHS